MALVKAGVTGRVATLTLNRPEALNALNTEVLQTLLAELHALAHRTDVGAVILTGAGQRAFAAGADIREMTGKSAAEALHFSQLGQMVTTTLERLPQPAIAAVNGYALGGGCEIALACDVRLCSDNARFGQPEINLGIMPGWGGTQRLTRLCGSGFARELIFTGRQVDSAEALRWGLVNAVYPLADLMQEATKLAEVMASKSLLALNYAKMAATRALDQDLAGGLAHEADLFALCFGAEDHEEGMTAFLEKREPTFRHR